MYFNPSLRPRFAAFVLAAALASAANAAEIVRDAYGVPHIHGESIPDAFFGYGYAVAEDRLFQLEMRRRQATGQLAAVLGSEVKASSSTGTVKILELDKQMRRDYDPGSLRAQFASLRADEQALIQAYLAGVNKRIDEVKASAGTLLPKQFSEVWGDELARKALNPWTLDDLLAATTNALTSYVSHTTMQDNALLLDALKRKYPADARKIFDTLLWVNDPYAPTTMENNPEIKLSLGTIERSTVQASSAADMPATQALADSTPSSDAQDTAATATSMAILVGGSKAAGSSIQLNGPQPGWFNPSYFYSVGLHAPGYDVVGHAPGGLLAITTGDNGHIAWGSTSAGGDHTTIFTERMSADRRSYEFEGKTRAVQTSSSSIEVKGEKPVQFEVHRTHRGPFITDLAADRVFSKQVLWKGHELTSVIAWQRATQAKDWTRFHAEGQLMAMGYNWFYSDKDGNIGWLFGGFFPDQTAEQKKANDPRLPAVGANGDMKGRSFADRIYLLNPESGYIVNWNNKPTVDYANRDLHIPRWAQGDRANILAGLMQRRAKDKTPFTQEDVQTIYKLASTQDVNFHHFGPLIRLIDAASVDAQLRPALKLLQQWDGARVGDATQKNYASPAVPIFQEWLNQLVKMTVGSVVAGDELKRFAPAYTGTLQLAYMKNSVNLSMGTKIALRGLQARLGMRPNDPPAYDVLLGKEPKAVMQAALSTALTALRQKQSGPLESWRQPMVEQSFFPENYESVPTASAGEKPGLPSSANRGAMQRLALGGNGKLTSLDANPPGTSADPGSAHYQDQLKVYGEWKFKPLPLMPESTAQSTRKTVRMTPASKL